MPNINQPNNQIVALTSKSKSIVESNTNTQGYSRTNELNENNFIKKMKTLSKTNVEITVKSLRAPKIKTDIHSVDTLRIAAKTGDVPATRYERRDHLNFKSSKSTRDLKSELAEEQIKNQRFA